MRASVGVMLIGAAMWLQAPALAGPGEAPGWEPLAVAVHVHSTASTGTLTLDQLAEEAERVGVDAILLSDNFALRYEYGLFPLRGGLKGRIGFPSLLDAGVEQYLRAVAAAQTRHPRVLLIPGAEVAPHYFWTGSILDGTLTMHNAQRNLLVLGLPAGEDYMALPVAGNASTYHYGWGTALDLMPVLLLVPAGWLWMRPALDPDGVGATPRSRHGRHRVQALGLGLGCVAALLLVNAWPFGSPVCSIYREDCGYRPSQAVIDMVASKGGLVYWSMPEAWDERRVSVGPFGTVTVRTAPYPDALSLTHGYTGFGGLYEDTRRLPDPGGEWDRLLRQYQSGARETWPVLLTESGFHGPGEDAKRLDSVQTVAWVRERTAPAVLEALARGRLYAVLRDPKEFILRLDHFRVQCEGQPERASLGETLHATRGCLHRIGIAVSSSDGGAHPLRIVLIRSGEVIRRLVGATPLEETVIDAEAPAGQPRYYRLMIKGEGELLSNPIFVRPRAEELRHEP